MQMNILEHIDSLLEIERQSLQNSGELDDATITEFFELRTQSVKVTVNFSGGIQKECWRVTQSNGSYSVSTCPRRDIFHFVSIAHWDHLILVCTGLPFVVFHLFEIHPNALLISLKRGKSCVYSQVF